MSREEVGQITNPCAEKPVSSADACDQKASNAYLFAALVSQIGISEGPAMLEDMRKIARGEAPE